MIIKTLKSKAELYCVEKANEYADRFKETRNMKDLNKSFDWLKRSVEFSSLETRCILKAMTQAAILDTNLKIMMGKINN